MPDFNFNWLSALVAAVAYFGLGAAWYGPIFGNTWAAGMGLQRDGGSMPPRLLAMSFAVTLLSTVAVFTLVAGQPTVSAVLTRVIWLWLGLVVTTTASSAIWDTRPTTVAGINAGYHLVGMLIAGLIYALWPAG